MAEGTSATVLWECSEGVICCLGVLDLLDSSLSNSGGLFTGLLGTLESFDLACFSCSIECLLSGFDLGVEGLLGLDEAIIDVLDWSEVVEGPLLSGIVEGLLGVNALLGGEGGGQNGSSSSSSLGGDVLSDISFDGILSQCGSGDISSSLFGHGSLVGGAGSSFSTSSWGDVSDEIDKEFLSTGEVVVGSLVLLLGKSLPSLGGSLVRFGGGEDVGLAGLGGLGFTNLSGGSPVLGLVALITDECELGSECGIPPVREPECDLGAGSSLPLGGGNLDATVGTEWCVALSSGESCLECDKGVNVVDVLHERIEVIGIVERINTIGFRAPATATVCLIVAFKLPACSLHGLKEELSLLPCLISVKSNGELAAVSIVERSSSADVGVISCLEGIVEFSWCCITITSDTLSGSIGTDETVVGS